MIHIVNEKIYTLYIGTEKLQVTGIHRFLINRNEIIQWLPVFELRQNDMVMFANGTWH